MVTTPSIKLHLEVEQRTFFTIDTVTATDSLKQA
nr:MAG TPA: hypothetical protein [Bacteriophage sp.]